MNMSKKRQIELTESGSTAKASKNQRDVVGIKSTKLKPLSFEEIAAIIRSGDGEKLKEIIAAKRVRDVNMHNKEKLHSLLMVASVSGFIECARVLLDHNADINYCSNYDGQSVLCSACMSGNADMFKFIIERGFIINDNVLAKVFSNSGIVLNTEIATILVGHIQDVNGERG